MHVHVERDRKTAKFWLQPVRLVSSRHFKKHELTVVEAMVARHEAGIVELWHERFGH